MSHLQMLYIAIVGFALLQSVSSVLMQSSIGIDDIRYVFHESPTEYLSINFDQTAEVFNSPKYDVKLPNMLYVPGYLDSPFSASSQLIVDAYFKLGGVNLFVLDWSVLSSGTYANAVANANVVGTKLGESYLFLFKNGITPENMQIIGHDIGAHLIGQAGRTVFINSNGAYKLPRLTGLDPALHLYYTPIAAIQHLSRSDANYVDIIHTDAGGYGTPRLTGTADYFVNTGRRFQPGCPVGAFLIRSDNDLCSHRRAIQLWAESVSTPTSTFTAVMFGNPSISSQMGYKSSTTTTPGKYILLTNAAAPFSRG